MLYLAIDQHCKQLIVTDRNEAGDATVRRQVSTKWEPVRAFFAEYAKRSQKEGGFVAIVEVCGFNQWLLEMLQEYSCKEIFLVQPEKRPKKKTDRRDVQSLGVFTPICEGRMIVAGYLPMRISSSALQPCPKKHSASAAVNFFKEEACQKGLVIRLDPENLKTHELEKICFVAEKIKGRYDC